MFMMKIVVAFGGNMITPKKNKGTYKELIGNIKKGCKILANLVSKYKLLIVSGSGPQIGALILQNEIAKNKIPPMPLDVLDAELEGQLGYLIEQSLTNELSKKRLKIPVATILTQVIVDKKDPSFKNPTKFVGPYYTKRQADKLKNKGLKIRADPRGGYRRVVPSPKPLKIVEARAIRKFTQEAVVIAAGGGGIPVIEENNKLKGIEAVIDKDLASAVLASNIKADMMLILTDVKCAYLNFKKPGQKPLRKLTIKQAKQYQKEGHFKEGSMGPKIQAAINFLKANKKGKVIITSPEHVEKALKGKEGTLIVG